MNLKAFVTEKLQHLVDSHNAIDMLVVAINCDAEALRVRAFKEIRKLICGAKIEEKCDSKTLQKFMEAEQMFEEMLIFSQPFDLKNNLPQ